MSQSSRTDPHPSAPSAECETALTGASGKRLKTLLAANGLKAYTMTPDGGSIVELGSGTGPSGLQRSLGEWLEGRVHPDDRERVFRTIGDALPEETSFELNYPVCPDSSDLGWERTHFAPIRSPRGALVEWLVSTSGMTGRKRLEWELRRREDRYRSLVESIEEGFCLLEVLFGDAGEPVDFRFLEVNPAFERHTGLVNATGKLMRSLAPDHEQHWFDAFGEVAKTGIPKRFDSPAQALEGRWFDVYAFRIDDPADCHVAVIFTEISERRRLEEVQRDTAELDAYRLKLEDALRPLADPLEIKNQAARILGEHLGASRVHYGEVLPGGRAVLVRSDYCDGVPSAAGVHHMRDYSRLTLKDALAGTTLVSHNVGEDSRQRLDVRQGLQRDGIGAYVVVPLSKENRLVAVFVAQQATPRQWTDKEIQLVEETAERTWSAAERAYAEAALRHAHRQTTAILESIDDCFYVLDRDGRFTYVNSRTEAYFGMPKEQMLGRVYADVLPATWGHEVLLKQREAAAARQTVRLETLSPVSGKWVDLTIFPTEDGGLTVYFRDVTDQVKARKRQHALLELGDRLRVLADPVAIGDAAAEIAGRTLGAVRAGYGTLDPNGERWEMAREWVGGREGTGSDGPLLNELGEPLAESLKYGEIVAVPSLAADVLLDARYRATCCSRGVKSFIYVPLVVKYRVAAVLYLYFDEESSFPESEIAFLRDVTDRTWAATQRARFDRALRESDRRKDVFLAMLAHELRNPLAVINNTAHLLEQGPAGETHRYVGLLRRQTDMLCGLVGDLLDVSRITRGLVELQNQNLDMGDVCRGALESVQLPMKERRHQVSVLLPESAVPIYGDAVRLEQIVVNLLTNAAKYTDPGGRISVCLETREDRVELRVKDNGIGMSAEVLEHIFDLFGQAERGLARAEGGLGIGLTIVKNMVELHNGQIEARSDGLGKGAEFIVTLPLAGSRAVEPIQVSTEREAPVSDSSKRILIVEDREDIAETMSVLLGHAGHRVFVAGNGRRGLEMAEEILPEVVLLDIGLPDMDGYEVARQLRNNPRTSAASLAALTGYGQPGDRARAYAAGFDVHFVKPVSLDALQRFVADGSSGE